MTGARSRLRRTGHLIANLAVGLLILGLLGEALLESDVGAVVALGSFVLLVLLRVLGLSPWGLDDEL